MSLINDALKRAGQKREPRHDLTNMQPVTDSSKGGPGLMILLVCLVFAGGITLGIWNYWNKKYKGGNFGKEQATNETTATQPATNNPLAKAAATFGQVRDRNEEGAATAAAIQPAAKPAVAAAEEGPRLQAIFFRLNDPTALIDGKTVKAGDSIEGGKVLEIKRESVRVELASGVRELTIKKR